MGRGVKRLLGSTLFAKDGEMGKVNDVLFNDQSWAIRYLVVETGGWLLGRKLLLSPALLGSVDWEARAVHVRLSRAQIEQSPDVSADPPVTRHEERRPLEYLGSRPYWSGVTATGLGLIPGAPSSDAEALELATPAELGATRDALASPVADALRGDDHGHLRSAREGLGYLVQALDGELGHLEDIIVNAETFLIEGLSVDTSQWRLGKHVLVSPRAVAEVDAENRTLEMRVTRSALDGTPAG